MTPEEIIELHRVIFTSTTNNLVRYWEHNTILDLKKRAYPEDLKASLNIPDKIKTFYDFYSECIPEAFTRYRSMVMISMCSNIECFFKDFFKVLFPHESFKNGFFQRMSDVKVKLTTQGIDLKNYKDFYLIENLFQIRHIFVHNLWFVDQDFIKKTGLKQNKEWEIFEIKENDYFEYRKAYEQMFYFIESFI